MTEAQSSCLCGNQQAFDQCCGRFLSGKERAETPEQLMRSRYSAYALGGHGEYLLRTWFPVTAAGLDAASLSKKNHQWTRLEVLDQSKQEDDGSVEFKAYFVDRDGRAQVMHEKSVFKRIAGRWLYVGGELN